MKMQKLRLKFESRGRSPINAREARYLAVVASMIATIATIRSRSERQDKPAVDIGQNRSKLRRITTMETIS